MIPLTSIEGLGRQHLGAVCNSVPKNQQWPTSGLLCQCEPYRENTTGHGHCHPFWTHMWARGKSLQLQAALMYTLFIAVVKQKLTPSLY